MDMRTNLDGPDRTLEQQSASQSVSYLTSVVRTKSETLSNHFFKLARKSDFAFIAFPYPDPAAFFSTG